MQASRSRQATAPSGPRTATPGSALGIAVVLVVAAIGSAIWWYSRLPVGQQLAHDTIHEPLVGAERITLDLVVGAGRLHLAAGSDTHVIDGDIETLIGIEELTRTSDRQGDTSIYRLISNAPLAIRESARWPRWDLNLHPSLPFDLTIRGGMGPSVLDLRDLTITDLSLDTGVGPFTIALPERGGVRATIQGGAGRTELAG